MNLEIHKSRFLLLSLSGLHAGAAFLVFFLALPLWVVVLINLLLVISLYFSLSGHALRSRGQAVSQLKLDSQGQCAVCLVQGGDWISCQVKEIFIHSRLVILRLLQTYGSQRYAVVIPWDAVDSESFRRLRVLVKQYPLADKQPNKAV